jgi:hypothetical protein
MLGSIGTGVTFRFRGWRRRSDKASIFSEPVCAGPLKWPGFPASECPVDIDTRGAYRHRKAGEEFPDGHDGNGQIFQR